MESLHPVVVHFAIALLSLTILFDFIYWVSYKDKYLELGHFTIALGTLAALVAVFSGNQARQTLDVPEDLINLVNQHQLSGEITIWLFIALVILRIIYLKRNWFKTRLRWIYIAVAVIGTIFLFRTGFLGGEMVYIYGLGTGKGQQEIQKTSTAKPQFYFEADTTQQ